MSILRDRPEVLHRQLEIAGPFVASLGIPLRPAWSDLVNT